MTTSAPLKVALLGCGVVGSQVARLLLTQDADLRARIGRPLELVGIAVRDAAKPREGIDPALLTTDAEALVRRLTGDNGTEVVSYGTEAGQFQAEGYSCVVCGPGVQCAVRVTP